jgi:hypothetical protein
VTVARATAALLGIWIFAGAGIEAVAWHERQLAAQARRHAVTQQNYAKAERFVDGCLRGHVVALDDLAYDCGDVRLLSIPARLLRDEIVAVTAPD